MGWRVLAADLRADDGPRRFAPLPRGACGDPGVAPAGRRQELAAGVLAIGCAVGLIWVIAFWLWFRDEPAEKRSVNAAEHELITRDAPPESRGHSMPTGGWGMLLRTPSLWALGGFYLFGSFGWSFFVSWMPEYFNKHLHVPYQKSSWLTAGPLFFGGTLVPRRRRAQPCARRPDGPQAPVPRDLPA